MKGIYQFLIVFLIISSCRTDKPGGNESVMITDLRPAQFTKRINEAPIAYLPLGTIEWHGEHLPLGADGMQAVGIFKLLAKDVGGLVYPMFFLGPDSRKVADGKELYGMDTGNYDTAAHKQYEPVQFAGSSYWISDTVFIAMLEGAVAQISRAGFKILVAHGHGPSTMMLEKYRGIWEEKYSLSIYHLFDLPSQPGKGYMADHAGKTETSITMALYPDLADLSLLPREGWPAGVGGEDPRVFASGELGREIIEEHLKMWTVFLEAELNRIKKEN